MLRAARTVFADKGFFNAKITDITREAGCSAGSFYTYYENKTRILDALLDEFTEQVTAASLASRSGDRHQQIHGVVAAFWTAFRAHRPEMIGLFGLKLTDARYAQRWREVRGIGISGIAAQLTEFATAGSPLPGDPAVLASALLSMLESFAWTWIAGEGDLGVTAPSDDEAIDTLSRMWSTMLFGPHRAGSAG